jgi:hypothetical protein
MALGPTELGQLYEVKIQSPLALVGAFLYLVRNRFKDDPSNTLNWKWRDDPGATDITIEAQYNQNTEARDVRPGIYIDRDQTTYGKVSIGNFDQNQHKLLQTEHTHHFSLGQTDIIMECISPVRGESMQLADITQTYLESSKYIIQAVFGFRDISPIVMSRTSPMVKQTDLHVTTLNFRVDYETRWATTPATAALMSLGVSLKETRQGVDSFLSNIYIKSTN